MEPELSSRFDRLQRRLTLMRQHAVAMERAQVALLERRLPDLERATEEQQSLCAQLRGLDPFSDQLYEPYDHAGVDEAKRQPSCDLLREFAAMHAKIRDLNRFHAALLQRARNSAALLSRLLASCAPTYAPALNSGGKNQRE